MSLFLVCFLNQAYVKVHRKSFPVMSNMFQCFNGVRVCVRTLQTKFGQMFGLGIAEDIVCIAATEHAMNVNATVEQNVFSS